MSKKRFEVIYEEGTAFSVNKVIMVDTETGVNYLFVRSGYGAGVTPLLDSEGKVVVTPIKK